MVPLWMGAVDTRHARIVCQAETISTVIGNETSRCSVAVSVCWPSVLIGSSSSWRAIELDARLLADRGDDVGDGDRAEQLALAAGLGGDRDDLRHERGGDRLWRPRGRWRRAWSRERRILAAWSTAPVGGLDGQALRAGGSCGRGRRRPRRCRRACRARRGRCGGSPASSASLLHGSCRRPTSGASVRRRSTIGPRSRASSRSRPRTAVATAVARRTGALRRHPAGVRQQRHLARDLDRVGDLALLLDVVAADPPVADLGAVAHEPRRAGRRPCSRRTRPSR